MSDQDEANARLIAAAPDMIEALQAARFCLLNSDKLVTNPELKSIVLKMVLAAIAKATGEDCKTL